MKPSETIRAGRETKDLTQVALAAALKITPARVSAWERGVRRPGAASAVALWRIRGGELADYLPT